MIELAGSALATICGGANTDTTVSGPGVRVHQSESDYARCVRTVVRQVDQAYPRPWPWQSDPHAKERLDATVDGLRRACGVPGQS